MRSSSAKGGEKANSAVSATKKNLRSATVICLKDCSGTVTHQSFITLFTAQRALDHVSCAFCHWRYPGFLRWLVMMLRRGRAERLKDVRIWELTKDIESLSVVSTAVPCFRSEQGKALSMKISSDHLHIVVMERREPIEKFDSAAPSVIISN